MERMANFLGISFSHNQAACLICDGRIVVAVQDERLTRRKNDGEDMFYGRCAAVDYCLDTAGITLQEVDKIVYNGAQAMPELAVTNNNPYTSARIEAVRCQPILEAVPPQKLHWLGHHVSHAWAGLAMSGWRDAAVLVVDGCGRATGSEPTLRVSPNRFDVCHLPLQEHSSFFIAHDNELQCLLRCYWPSDACGPGETYERIAEIIFGDGLEGVGKLMGLSPYGDAEACPFPLLTSFDQIPGHYVSQPDWTVRYREHKDDGRLGQSGFRRFHECLAARIQCELETSLLEQVEWLYKQTRMKHLIISGGVGLNSVANARVLRDGPFQQMFVVPAANDAGIALGCAYRGFTLDNPKTGFTPPRNDYLGRSYSQEKIEVILQAFAAKGVISYKRLAESELLQETVQRLADGHIIAWFMGGSEFGPRALGHRSILADASGAEIKARINVKVKHREEFRPFAPAVLEKEAGRYFDIDRPSPYMMFVVSVREAFRERFPAICHVDGTARVQTVSEDNGIFFRLLHTWHQATGDAILLNTSLNIMGEPIVEKPEEAVRCLLTTGLEGMAIGEFWVDKCQLNIGQDKVPRSSKYATWSLSYENVAGVRHCLQIDFHSSAHQGKITAKSLSHLGDGEVRLQQMASFLYHLDGVIDIASLAEICNAGPDELDEVVLFLLAHGLIEC